MYYPIVNCFLGLWGFDRDFSDPWLISELESPTLLCLKVVRTRDSSCGEWCSLYRPWSDVYDPR